MKKRQKILLIIILLICFILGAFIIKNNKYINKKVITVQAMTQSENEANLQTQIDALNEAQEEYATNVQAYKKQIAQAVTNQGVATSENDTGAVIATNIGKILSTKTVATATAANILKDKTAWVNGTKVTGTMTNNGAVTKTLSAGGSYTIPAGYHNGSGKVTVNTLASQTDGTATAANILKDKTAYVDGKLVTGTMTNNGTVNKTLNAGGSYTIPAGYHSGTGKVTATALKDQTAGTATAANITKGKTAWVNGTKITGTGADNDTHYNQGYSAGTSTVTIYSLQVSYVSVTNYNYKHKASISSIPNYSNLVLYENCFPIIGGNSGNNIQYVSSGATWIGGPSISDGYYYINSNANMNGGTVYIAVLS